MVRCSQVVAASAPSGTVRVWRCSRTPSGARSASRGATLFKGEELYWQELMKKADAAMYQAKAAGRNRVQFDASQGL